MTKIQGKTSSQHSHQQTFTPMKRGNITFRDPLLLTRQEEGEVEKERWNYNNTQYLSKRNQQRKRCWK